MPTIKEFIVVEPPTSGEVQERVVNAMLAGGLIELVIKAVQEVPKPIDENISFHLKQTTHPAQGEMIIAGMTEDFRSVIVTTHGNPESPATGRAVEL